MKTSRLFLILAAFLLAGCANADHSAKMVVQSWNSRFTAGTARWDTSTSIDEFVYEGIAVKDYEYRRYVELIRRGTSWGGFGAQVATIGLNAAIPLTGTGTGKTLSAIAATITGGSAAFSKNILFDQSITVFVGRMDALRKGKLKEIQDKLANGGYSHAQAYRDIQDYGYQGTLDAALANVATSTPTVTKPQ